MAVLIPGALVVMGHCASLVIMSSIVLEKPL
jgi:hypothetical protein